MRVTEGAYGGADQDDAEAELEAGGRHDPEQQAAEDRSCFRLDAIGRFRFALGPRAWRPHLAN